jgi:hypothetical protein
MPRLKTRREFALRTITLADALGILKCLAADGVVIEGVFITGVTHVRMSLSEKYEVPRKARPSKVDRKLSGEAARPGRVHLHGTEGTVREFRG